MMPQRTKARYSNSVLRKLGTFNDKLYALYEATPLNKRQGVYIRKDWLDKLGLAAPTTLDEFLNVARAFTAQDPDGDGKNDTYGFSATLDSTVLGLGSQFNFLYGAYGLPGTWDLRTPGKVSLNLHDPAYLQATEFVKQLVVNKVIDPDWTTLGTDDFRARWKQGKYGIFADDFSATFGQANYQAFDENNPNGVLVPLSPPKGSGGSAYLGVNSDIAIGVAASQQAISSGKGPAIARLLEWLNSGEGYYLSGFGKEGINYKLDAQKNIITTGVPQPWTTHAAQTGIQIRNLSLNGSPAELKARYPSYKSIKGRTIDPMKVYLTQAAMPWIDVTSTSAIPPAANQADINRFVSEGIVQFVTGQKPLTAATWSTFLKNLDSLNVSDWVSKANSTLKTKGLLPT
jgi:putative aldouronate transport system substrate-binding protein